MKDSRVWRYAMVLALLATLAVGCGTRPVSSPNDPKLVLATTTSTYDSGLLDQILPDFEASYGAQVEVIAVGTGQAIKTAENGDADVILVHARAKEDKFVADGYGVDRRDVMYNDFVVLGAKSDPAGIEGMTDAAAALGKIAEAEAPFVSRGDESGTHAKEKEIWQKAGVEPGGEWYMSLGQGMGATLTVANEKGAYTLADRGTYLSREGDLDLQVMVEGDPLLSNPYGVIRVNPERWPQVNTELAGQFVDWLTSVETQERIAAYQHSSGLSLFHPNSEQWKAAQRD